MMQMQRTRTMPMAVCCTWLAAAALVTVSARSAEPDRGDRAPQPATALSLRSGYSFADPTGETVNRLAGLQSVESTSVTTSEQSESWDLVGPYFLRSADPEAPGELELKFIYGYETESDGSEHEFEFVLEWGMAENWEFIFEVPVILGEGRVEGNGDISFLGFHTRFWEESGWLPALAMRNSIRVPTGYHSSGVDYTARGLITKSIIPGVLRAHANPFLTTIGGHIDEDVRRFQWGAVIGVDYRVNDDLLLIADYQNLSSKVVGQRNDHLLELGADWEFAEDQTLGFSTVFGLDGDESGLDWGMKISYIIEFGAPRLDTP